MEPGYAMRDSKLPKGRGDDGTTGPMRVQERKGQMLGNREKGRKKR